MQFLKIAAMAVLALVGQSEAKSTFSPARPPAAPLAVRSPYLNVWLNGRTDGGDSGYLAGQWPRFWTQNVNGWQGIVKVDGKAYSWMGGAPGLDYVDQVSLSYTSTNTEFVMNVAGKVQMRIRFLSPVFPTDLQRQSIPFSYMDVSVKPLDGRSHTVQVYSDVSAEWASGDNGAIIQWESGSSDGIRSHKFWRRDQVKFDEYNDQASWGNWYWSTADVRGLTYQIGADVDVRNQFVNNGMLTNNIDTQFRAVSDRWPVFAYSRDLGRINGETSTLFTIGIAQEDAILFSGIEKNVAEPSLWKSYFSNESDLVKFFFKDYSYATQASNKLDQRIADDSIAKGGKDYLTITSLALRQSFGGLGYAGTKDDVKVFLKEISSDSDIQTVDVIFPAFPVMLYLNPNIIKWTLEPLLQYQKSGRYPNKWAVHDLGRYPRALGYDDGNDEPMPLEECGNMIIMMLAYAQRTGDNKFLSDNWKLMDQWAGYLIEDAKIPAHQLSTDDFAGRLANQTNLAIKGIIALEAMSEIAKRSGNKDSIDKYSKVAHDYLDFWSTHGINHNASPPHTTLQYDAPDTYGLLYNVYGDKVLGLDFIPQEVYDMQSKWYPHVKNQYGMVLDTRGTLTKTDWEMFVAAVSSKEVRDEFISLVAKWINETKTWRAFTDLYDTVDGGYPRGIEFVSRPVVGGVFALLALP